MDTAEATRDVLAEARYLGADAALAGASWAIMSVSDAASIVADVDPAVLDRYPEPNLSGEWADDLTPDLLASELVDCADGCDGIHLVGRLCDSVSVELVEAIADAWEEGRDLVWSDALQAVALRTLGRITIALTVERQCERQAARLRRAAGR